MPNFTCLIYSHPGFTPFYQHLQGPCWYQIGSTKGNLTYHLYVPYPVLYHACSSHLVPRHLTILYSETPKYPNSTLRIATGYHLHQETKMLSVQDHLSLIISKYLPRALQSNNSSHNGYQLFSLGYQKHETNPSISVSRLCCSLSIKRYSTPH